MSRYLRFSTAWLAASAAVCMLATAGFAESSPLRWTPAFAGKLAHGKCVGIGKPVVGKYAAFKCTPGSGGVVWAKIRPDGRKLCWSRTSLAAIQPVCLVVPGQG